MTTTSQFKKFAEKHYAKAFYNNVMFLVKCGAKRGDVILDACCGPGLFAEKLVQEGFGVTLFDENAEYLQEARKIAPDQVYIRGDILTYDDEEVFDSVDGVVFTNTSGYFTPKQLTDILKRLSGAGRFMVANFFVEEDQKWAPYNRDVLIGVKGRTFSFALGNETLNLRTIKEKELEKIFKDAGYHGNFIYTTDFKTERLYLLKR